MSDDVHQRAERLIVASRVEELSASEREWLNLHLESCARCARCADSTEQALRSLRAVSVRVSPDLIRATRLRVYARALERRERRTQLTMLWISCALSWVLGAFSAPFVWRAFAWLGEHHKMPVIAWQLGFALWWTLPAAVVAVVLVVRRAQAQGIGGSVHRLR
jgi:anti-sigma factor RsiW